MKAILLFPGQGSQCLGMSLSFFEAFQSVRHLFEAASDCLHYDCLRIIRDDPDNFLNQTRYTQPLLFLASFVAFKVTQAELGLAPVAAAGA